MEIQLNILNNDELLDLIVLDIVFNGIPRTVYERSDHFNTMADLEFFQHFRMEKRTVLQVLERIEHSLEYLHNL
jgi:hypothetical protein